MKLSTDDKREIRELHSKEDNGNHLVYYAKIFNVSTTCIEYLLYPSKKKYYIKKSYEWQAKNPEKWKVINRKAVNKFNKTEKGRQYYRNYYLQHKEMKKQSLKNKKHQATELRQAPKKNARLAKIQKVRNIKKNNVPKAAKTRK